MTVDAAIDRFDAFLDDLVQDRADRHPHVNPEIMSTARTLHLAVEGTTADSAFANRLRGSLLSQALPEANRLDRGIARPAANQGMARVVPHAHRTRTVQYAAIAALIIILFIGGLATRGHELRFSWFGNDEPPRLAAPGVPSSTAFLFIVDKSGSMSYDPLGRTSKIEMAKAALRAAIQILPDGDQVGILVFNDQQQWIVLMSRITDQAARDQINAAIEGIAADGGTEIYPALSVGYDAIRRVEADVRHIVLLSDGKSRTGTRESYQALINDATFDHITLSTIAIGHDADTDLLQYLAEQGGGLYYFTERASDIPDAVMSVVRSLLDPQATSTPATPGVSAR